MGLAAIYAEGFVAQKDGAATTENPFPLTQQPEHLTWWCGWKRGEMARAVGRDGAEEARRDYIRLHGDV